MKGPRIVEAPVGEGCSAEGTDGLAVTIDAGIPPVGTASEDSRGLSAAEVAGSEGCTMVEGIPPVGATAGAEVAGSEGRTIDEGIPPVEATPDDASGTSGTAVEIPVGCTTEGGAADEAGMMVSGMPPVDPTFAGDDITGGATLLD